MRLGDLEISDLGRIIALALGFIGVLQLAYVVLNPFFGPLTWASILVYITWPLYRAFRRLLDGRAGLAAFLMTLLLALLLILPALWIVLSFAREAPNLVTQLNAYVESGNHRLPAVVTSLPWIGELIQRQWDQLLASTPVFRQQILAWLGQGSKYFTTILGGIGRSTFKTVLTIFTAYFLYRHGEEILRQARLIAISLLGNRASDYLQAIGDTVRAVVYGILLTAIAQGLLAGLGYWVAGVPAPVLLTLATILLALVPFATPFVWGSVAIWLLVQGHTLEAIGLALWGILVISWVDNLIRPLVISSATKISFLLVMFGVLGGLAAFGFVGLFIGPVILAILLAVWREWLEGVDERAAGIKDGNAQPPAS